MSEIYDINDLKRRVEEEKGSSEVTNDIIDASQDRAMIQPLLFLQGDGKETDDLIKYIENNKLLHSAPAEASSYINAQFTKRIVNDEEYAKTIKEFEYYIYNSKVLTIVEEITRYVSQNVLISFCNLIDWTGPVFTEIVSNIPLKAYVSNILNDNEHNGIKNLISRYIHEFSKASYVYCFNPSNDDAKQHLDGLYEKNKITSLELAQIIYHDLCKACDDAITESILGTRNVPNLKYIFQTACKYFGIKFVGLDNRQEIYIKLNATLVHMIDELMGAVIVPMCDQLFAGAMFASYYFGSVLSYDSNDSNKENITSFEPF